MAKPISNGRGQRNCTACGAPVTSGWGYTGIQTPMGWVCSPGCKQKTMRHSHYRSNMRRK